MKYFFVSTLSMGYKGFLNYMISDVFYFIQCIKNSGFLFSFFNESIHVHNNLGGEAQNSKNG